MKRIPTGLTKALAQIALAGLLAALAGCRSDSRTVSPGLSAPQFRAADLQGVERSLAEFRGKVVLLNFWASWCPPCIQEMPELEALHQKLGPQGLVVIGIGVEDTPEALREIVKQTKVTFPIVQDPHGEIKLRYGIGGLPETFVVDRKGKMVLLTDPGTMTPTLRVIGPRNWGNPQSVSVFSNLLSKN